MLTVSCSVVQAKSQYRQIPGEIWRPLETENGKQCYSANKMCILWGSIRLFVYEKHVKSFLLESFSHVWELRRYHISNWGFSESQSCPHHKFYTWHLGFWCALVVLSGRGTNTSVNKRFKVTNETCLSTKTWRCIYWFLGVMSNGLNWSQIIPSCHVNRTIYAWLNYSLIL